MDYVHPEDVDWVGGMLARAVRTGESQAVASRIKAADGHWVTLRTVAWTLDGADDEVLVVAISVPADQGLLSLSAWRASVLRGNGDDGSHGRCQ